MRHKIVNGDALTWLRNLPDSKFDSIVTDAPYGIALMRKGWDNPDTNPAMSVEFWRETLRVLKPGAYAIIFGSPRMHHRVWAAVEDAGFEIRDTIVWLHAQGMGKSMDASKAIDKHQGNQRKIVGRKRTQKGDTGAQQYATLGVFNQSRFVDVTAPGSYESALWEGWGTMLKPAIEPILIARKPLAGTVAKNLIEHGCGALNLGACTIGDSKRVPSSTSQAGMHWGTGSEANPGKDPNVGRMATNAIISEDIADELGERAKYYYCPKPSRAEKRLPDGSKNKHEACKPIALMEYLCKLVTPANGRILDPFCGSGTTGVAAIKCGFRFLGIEKDSKHAITSQARLIVAGMKT